MTTLLAQTETVGNTAANIGIFSLFVVVTMVVVIRASKRNATAAEFFTGGRGFTGPQNGIAIAGDYLSAASFLGIAGAIAVYGYDGFLYSIGFLVAWLVALLLVAELLRNTGKFTMADVLSFRLKQRPVRLAAATNTLTVSLFYLLAQMAGAGGLVALLLNVNSSGGQAIVIAVVGVLMILYVLVGGMKGTTWVQIIKAVLLIAGAGAMTLMVLGKFGLNFSEILGAAQSAISGSTTEAVANRDVLAPGAQYGGSLTSQINFISLAIALVLGTLVAIALVRQRWRGHRAVDTFLVLPLTAPEVVIGAALLTLFLDFGWAAGYTTILIAHIAFEVSFIAMTVRARVRGFDWTLEDASLDLGAGPARTFFRVTLPLIVPGIVAAAMLSFALSLDDFIITYFVSGSTVTYPLYVNAAVKAAVPPQINVLATAILGASLLLLAVGTLWRRKRFEG